jgi:ferritin
LLQWFISEQVEEEAAVNQILDVIEKAGAVSIYLADKEIGAMRAGK